MNALTRLLFRACLTLVAAGSITAHADVRLPRLFSDGMVLQRGKPVLIWGWADEGEPVTVQLGSQTLATKARNSRWQLTFHALKTGPTYQISIRGKNQLTLHDVLVGDVWIAAGQSNMEMQLSAVTQRYPDLIATTDLPAIREFSVPTIHSFNGAQEDFPSGQWKTATPANLEGFSAVGFFFARKLQQATHVPIGIISLAVGGSPAQAWMSEQALIAYPHYLLQYQKLTDRAVLQKTIADDQASVAAWYATAAQNDLGLVGQNSWRSADLNTDDWQTLTVPGKFSDQQIDFSNGIIWLRKTVNLTQQQSRNPATLLLGAMVDGDEVTINDQPVGQTTYRYPNRRYTVPDGVLHAGPNTIVIRLTSYSSEPGFVSDKPYVLQLGAERISLEGEWRYRVGMRGVPFPVTTTLHYQPATLFNAKLAPTLRTAIRGVIWYQGESNTGNAGEYASLFPAMIHDWRRHFNQGDFPFLYVQLANFMEAKADPSESDWAQTRQAQRSALTVRNTGMAVTIDLGEWNDIHPQNKQEVGERLALLARKMSFGEHGLIASGPMAISVSKSAAGLLVKFAHCNSRLLIRGAALNQIAIAGADHHFYWASARVTRNNLLVWNDQVSDPRTVRYAWSDNPAGANLTNDAGLPASPFALSIDDAKK